MGSVFFEFIIGPQGSFGTHCGIVQKNFAANFWYHVSGGTLGGMRLLPLLLSALLVAVHALYADELGVHDWKLENVGSPSFAVFGSKAVILATADGVLASVSLKTGTLNWRKVLSDGKTSGCIILAAAHFCGFLQIQRCSGCISPPNRVLSPRFRPQSAKNL